MTKPPSPARPAKRAVTSISRKPTMMAAGMAANAALTKNSTRRTNGNAQVDDDDALASLGHDRVLRLRRPSWFARVTPAASSSRCNENGAPTHDHPGTCEQRPQGRDPQHPGLSEARHHVSRHHHASRQCAGVPPRRRRIGAAMGRQQDRQGRRHRGARLHPRRRRRPSGLGRLRADPQEGQAAVQARDHRLFARIRHRRDGDARGRGVERTSA